MSGSYFVTLPARVFLDRRLTLPQLRLLGIIASHQTAKTGWAYLDQAALAAEYDAERPPSRQAISKHLQKLIAFGYIKSKLCHDSSGHQIASGYSVVQDAAVDETRTNEERQQEAKTTHKPNCPCEECHWELWWAPMTPSHAIKCKCPECMRKRFAKSTVS